MDIQPHTELPEDDDMEFGMVREPFADKWKHDILNSGSCLRHVKLPDDTEFKMVRYLSPDKWKNDNGEKNKKNRY